MRQVTIECETTSVISVDRIADAFAATNSEEQAVILQELFDALLHKCENNTHRFRLQLSYIAVDMTVRGYKQGQEGIRMLFEELENRK